MNSRRHFIKSASALALGGLLLSSDSFAAKKKKKIGLQLYTVRDDIKKDLAGTIKAVGEIGYTYLEAAGYGNGKYYGMSPADFKKLVNDNGMEMISTHVGTGTSNPAQVGTMTNGWEQAVEDAKAIGCKYIIVPSLAQSERNTIDDYKKLAERFNKAGEIAKEIGLQFGYHNHAFEFTSIDGVLPYDILLKETDASLVKMELDLFWATKAGKDPVEMFKQNPGRYELWHVKDMEDSPEKAFAEVGSGTMDFEKIYANKKVSGMKYQIVEQDVCKRPALDCIKTSYDYLSKAKFV